MGMSGHHHASSPLAGAGGLTSTAADRAAWIALAHAAEPADAGVARLVADRGPQEAVASLRAGSSGLRHQEGLASRLHRLAPEGAEDRAARLGARIITPGEREWPTQIDALAPLTPMAL